MTNEQGIRVVAISWLLLAVGAGASFAQTETDSARDDRHHQEEASLAKASQNPVANLVSLPLQYNFFTAGGLGPTSAMVLNVQPVLPLPIGKNWLIISRTIVPFTSVPLSDTTKSSGIADIQEQVYFTSSKPQKFTWGAGPIFSFPTATNNFIQTGQWGLGPTAVGLVMPGPWVIGLLANNVWRIGGDARGHVLNTFTMQPFINYNLAHAWAITTAPIITSDWSAPDDERWTVPIGLGFSKIAHIGDQPMNFSIQYYHNVKHPSLAGSEQMRFVVAALWPTSEAKEREKKLAAEREAKEKAARSKEAPKQKER